MNVQQAISCSYCFFIACCMCKIYFIMSYCIVCFYFCGVLRCFCALIRHMHYYSHKHFINSWLCRRLSNDQYYYVHVSTRYAILL